MCAKLTLGLIGYGAFGKLIYPHLCYDFDVLVHDPALDDRHILPKVELEEAARCDIVVIAAPVQAIGEVAVKIASIVRPGALVLDVGSVKIRPAQILSDVLPAYVDLICTHPLFGPQSAKGGLEGLKIVLCPIRGRRLPLVKRWLKSKSLKVISTTPDRHDREMALSQGITHLIAKVIANLCPSPSDLTTPSFDLMIDATEMVRYDAPEVFRAIERDNPHAVDVRRRFFDLAEALKYELEKGGD